MNGSATMSVERKISADPGSCDLLPESVEAGENYVFDAASATGWAACVEYEGDFSSKNFSLAGYYQMCDELLDAIRENEELTGLCSGLFEEELDGYEDQLHILVYDIMDCASLYRYYAGMDIRRIPSRERYKDSRSQSCPGEAGPGDRI